MVDGRVSELLEKLVGILDLRRICVRPMQTTDEQIYVCKHNYTHIDVHERERENKERVKERKT